MKKLAVIILAAGQGTRMKSKVAKVLHKVAGRPMVRYAVDLAEALSKDQIAVVVGHQAEAVKEALADRRVMLVLQEQRLGTGHAVTQTQRVFQGRGGQEWKNREFIILSGDVPLLSVSTLRSLLAVHRRERAMVSVLTTCLGNPAGYGRIVRDERGLVSRIVEEKDASPVERQLKEINTGTYVVDGEFLFPALKELKPANAQKEYYLTDIVSAAVSQGKRVAAYVAVDSVEAMGVNTRRELADAERVVRTRIRNRLMESGVTFIAPETSLVDVGVRIGRDCVIYPFTTIEGDTMIGEDCVVRAHSRITDSRVGKNVTILDACVIEGSHIEEGATIGPFARLRPETIVRRAAKVGNFVELKKTELGVGAKANHLTYLGDTRIGRRVNIGAGTITCNYDGVNKYRTEVGDDVFIGSDVSLVAPVKVGRGAIIGAGSVITENVASEALVLGRARQIEKAGWAKRFREKSGKAKH